MQILKKTLNIIIDVLIIVMLVFSAVVAGLAIASRSDGVPNLFGYAPLSVQSDSMVPTFESGDLIITKVVSDGETFDVGDVISFPATVDGVDVINTHRIVKVENLDNTVLYFTKGDNNAADDEDPVLSTSVLAAYSGTCFKGLGTVYDFLTGQLGFFLVILLPLIIFFIYEVIRVVRNLIAYNREKAYDEAVKANSGGLSEEEMKLAVENYLSQQKENESASSEKTDDSNSNDTEE